MGEPHLLQDLRNGFIVPNCGRGKAVLHLPSKWFVQPTKRLPVFFEHKITSLPSAHFGHFPITRSSSLVF